MNYANITQTSTNKNYQNQILGKQKRTTRLVLSDDISVSPMFLMKQFNILNLYQINILHRLLFISKVKSGINPRECHKLFLLANQICPTKFSDNIFKLCDFNLKLTNLVIGFKGPTEWNIFLLESEKSYTSISVFKIKIKEKIINYSNQVLFF